MARATEAEGTDDRKEQAAADAGEKKETKDPTADQLSIDEGEQRAQYDGR